MLLTNERPRGRATGYEAGRCTRGGRVPPQGHPPGAFPQPPSSARAWAPTPGRMGFAPAGRLNAADRAALRGHQREKQTWSPQELGGQRCVPEGGGERKPPSFFRLNALEATPPSCQYWGNGRGQSNHCGRGAGDTREPRGSVPITREEQGRRGDAASCEDGNFKCHTTAATTSRSLSLGLQYPTFTTPVTSHIAHRQRKPTRR